MRDYVQPPVINVILIWRECATAGSGLLAGEVWGTKGPFSGVSEGPWSPSSCT